MPKIKTFEEACEALSIKPNLPAFTGLPLKHQNALIAHYKLIIIAQALNDGWEPNWNDTDELKYYPWFEVKATAKKPSGVGLSCVGCGGWRSYAGVGSRLCFKTSDLAKYAGTKFKKLYEEYFLIQQQ